MIRTLSLLALLPISVPAASEGAPAEPAPLHCQVPCGIYGDSMRIDMLMEDATTIEKGMQSIQDLEKAGIQSSNQLVRWIVTKEDHAQKIQDMVAAYWLAQRIKAPAGDDQEAKETYYRQLALLHGITVAAMKCKQTTETENVEKMRKLAIEFSGTYFTEEDLKHIREHHAGEHR